MNFKNAKDHVLTAALALIIAYTGSQVQKLGDSVHGLAEAIVAMKQNDSFQDYRLNQQRDQIKELATTVGKNESRLTRLETKVLVP